MKRCGGKTELVPPLVVAAISESPREDEHVVHVTRGANTTPHALDDQCVPEIEKPPF
jgi:hypothetical protein